MNNVDNLLSQLRVLGLTTDEARIYLELLKDPSTHLRLAQVTGINRTKIYRLAADLEKRSLVTRRTDDRGTFLVAADAATLGIAVAAQEERSKQQRTALDQLLPALDQFKVEQTDEFAIHTYEGIEGFKQMLWHELRAREESLIFGSGTIDDLITDHHWAERLRAATVEAGYHIRELLNPGDKDKPFTLNDEFMRRYVHRRIPRELLPLDNQIVVYNDTVATYHWRNNQKVGLEVVNKDYATLMRTLFEHYWQLASNR